jgi:23S rRNA (cytidine1920-2'-O)/16S rRNA (cytidine1409-2'-O)-methyltransferase
LKSPPKKPRLDQLLVDRGLFPSREQARRAVMAGQVEVDGRRVDKAGTPVDPAAAVTLIGPKEPFVSRAGRKLAGALDRLGVAPEGRTGVDPAGLVCLDVGASTGGFTDCLLQRGARRVYALDVGYGLLDARLRADPRVVVIERTNARRLAPDALPERCSLVTVDVSFISLAKVVPALLPHLAPDGDLLALVKPQFEAGRGAVGKGGILRDEEVRRRAVEATAGALVALGLRLDGLIDSAVAGAGGNRESFALLRREGATER